MTSALQFIKEAQETAFERGRRLTAEANRPRARESLPKLPTMEDRMRERREEANRPRALRRAEPSRAIESIPKPPSAKRRYD